MSGLTEREVYLRLLEMALYSQAECIKEHTGFDSEKKVPFFFKKAVEFADERLEHVMKKIDVSALPKGMFGFYPTPGGSHE